MCKTESTLCGKNSSSALQDQEWQRLGKRSMEPTTDKNWESRCEILTDWKLALFTLVARCQHGTQHPAATQLTWCPALPTTNGMLSSPTHSAPIVVASILVHLPPHGGLLIGGPGNGAPPPSKSSPYAIIYSPRAETKHTSKVYDAAPLNDRLRELIHTVIFVLINHGCFAKLGPLQGFNFFNSIH